jgi:hypothetical protein
MRFIPDSLIITYNRFRGIEPAPIGMEYNFIKGCIGPNRNSRQCCES